MYDTARLSGGDITVDGNDIIGGSAGVEIDYAVTNQNVAGTATVDPPAYYLVNNVLARAAQSGLRVNGDAPVNLIHNTIAKPANKD